MSPIIYRSFLLPSTRRWRMGGEGGSWGMSYTQGSGPVLGYAALSGLGCVCSYFERDLHCFWKNNAKTLRFENFAYINDAITMGGRLCRYLLLRCLPTGLCFGQSSWHWKIWHCSVMHVSFFKHVCNFLPIEVLIVIKLLVIMMV